MGPDGLLYLTDLERDAISRVEADGVVTPVAVHQKLSWPDAIEW